MDNIDSLISSLEKAQLISTNTYIVKRCDKITIVMIMSMGIMKMSIGETTWNLIKDRLSFNVEIFYFENARACADILISSINYNELITELNNQINQKGYTTIITDKR